MNQMFVQGGRCVCVCLCVCVCVSVCLTVGVSISTVNTTFYKKQVYKKQDPPRPKNEENKRALFQNLRNL